MPVNSPHPAYTKAAPTWQAIKDVLDGAQAVKCAGPTYLPKLFGMTDEDYEAYKGRTVFFGATARTAEAYLGMIMRKPPVTTATGLEAFMQDVDLMGNPWNAHCEQVVSDLSTTSRGGDLIDWNAEENRPYVTHYAELAIINWNVERVDGLPRLTMLVLEEWSSTPMQAGEMSKDPFCVPCIQQWRVFEALSTGVVCSVWRKEAKEGAAAIPMPGTDQGTKFIKVEEHALERRGKVLTYIPFVFHGLGKDRVQPGPPMLADLVEVNLGHYRQSADYENGLHMIGLPQPWAVGFTAPEGQKTLTIGTSRAWVSDNTEAKAGYLEFSGAGMKAIKDAMDDKKKDMASLGARAIQPEKADAEAFDTVKMRASAETATLGSIAQSASRSLSEVLAWVQWWVGADTAPALDSTLVAINTDFVPASMDPALMAALMAAFQGNLISWETFFFQMQKGEMYSQGRTIEQEQKAITANPLPPPVPPTPPGNDNPGA